MIDSDSQNTCIQKLLCVIWDTKNEALKGKTIKEIFQWNSEVFWALLFWFSTHWELLIFNSSVIESTQIIQWLWQRKIDWSDPLNLMENLVVKITWCKTLFFTMLVQHFIYRSLLHRVRLVCGRLKCSIRYSGFILIRKSKHGKSCKMKISFIKTAFGTCRQQTKHTKSSKKISQKCLYGLILEPFEIICEMKIENIVFL